MESKEYVSWMDLGVWVALSVPYQLWREAPWLRLVVTDDDEQGPLKAFRLVEEPYVPLIEGAVVQILEGGEPNLLRPPANHLLALRMATVGSLLMSFEGVLPAPPIWCERGIQRRFLLEWWREHGALYAVGSSFSELDVYRPGGIM